MRRSHLTFHVLVLLGLFLNFRPACADTNVPAVRTVGVTVEDFSYLDTSGEPADQTAAHQQRLRAFMTALRRDIDADGRYRTPSCTPPCGEQGPASAQQNQSAAQGEARIRIIGGIHKMSTLVQWAKVAVVEIDTNRILFERSYSFRGDNDEAWGRAEAFVFRDIRELLAAYPPTSAAAEPRPIGLAVFDFELEDTTAAAPATGVAASDAGYLADVTKGVRELLQQSGRYRVIDASGATADAAKKHALRDCGGCDAGIAQKLGADQSLIGVVRRVSRTEYTIGFQIRDARTGAVVSKGDSGLRMGADYSWRRGAVYLVSDRLLGSRSQQ
jgi:hypothetical protein